MSRLLLGLLLCQLTLSQARAEDRDAVEKHHNIDLSSYTCQLFLEGLRSQENAEKMHDLVMWLEGYLGGISGNTTLIWQDLLDYKQDLLTFCDKNPTLGLLEAARRAAVE